MSNSTLTFANVVQGILGIANTLIPVLLGLAVIAFFVGLIRYIYSSSGGGHAEGRDLIQWGLVALFVLVCIWGIVTFLSLAFFGQNSPGI